MNCRQWVVDVYPRADALTLNGEVSSFQFLVSSKLLETRNSKLETALMLFRHRTRQIHHRQQDENVGLQERHADVQAQKHYRNTNGIREKKAIVTMSPANILA